ncbi:H-NS family nucleoid-associated regulatory protein [Paraburkholderia fungorum]|uniref:DNA-binding protein H-NS-like C-terminal domain-containing protein n=1 Tax=Paraburkholderia fungorum TaxID=134537 RepID=A0A420FUW6_9BURK|nr:H-NS histone family protein [Paraburkholderia fungorum]RKF36718.1 hypothetical protein BCY88_35370 [Paraburkholderia fungorum]
MGEKTYVQLLGELATLNEQIEKARAVERRTAIQDIRALMREYGIVPSELVGRKRGRPQVPPRYMDPETRQTWNGWGKRPAWLDGKDVRAFRIKTKQSATPLDSSELDTAA